MPSERVQRRIDRLLDQAESAADGQEWSEVERLIREVLALDPENEDSPALLRAAREMLGETRSEAEADPAQPSHLAEPASPTSFANGRYEVTGFLGEGGKKKVYLAHDTTLDRDVAFALIKAEGLDDASRQRVTREAQAMARLGDNPNIMPIFDLGEENGQPYMVGPLMGGGDVEALIEEAEDNRLSLEDALRIASEICHGLEFAHSKSIIHRDLKPGNVWLTDDGTARIGDFGLALSLDRSRLTQEKMMVGTVSYMPPEQATGGDVTPRSDLYSLGAMLYEMVTGRPPFMGDDEIAIIGQHINTPPVAPQWHRPEIPATLDSLIMRLLSKNPAERPDSAGDVLSALTAIDATPREVPADVDGSESGSLDGMAGGVFVGRQREMDQLKASLENALSGRGRMVTLVGEPGIGKSRTALELQTYAGLRNAQVLWGRCYEGGGAPPYWPWVQAIRSFVSSHEPQEVRSQMGSTASVIAEIVADVKESLPDVQPPPTLDDPESARFRLFDSVATFLRNAGNVQPIVLVLDDLHWADGPSLKMLEFVARELASSRVMLVGTYRDMELNRRHPLSVTLGDLTREHLFERVLLRGLTREDVSRFIEIAAGVVPPRGLIDAVHTQTEGNPLFVTETVRLLIQQGEFTQEGVGRSDSSWNIRIPEGVREVIGRRLDRLSERCNEMLTIASVIGRQFTLDQLRTVVEDTTENQLLDVLDEALDARTIEELPDSVGEYQFTHALIQETLSDELSATRIVRLHARIATAMESMYGSDAIEHAEQLAAHFAEAETVLGTERMIHYLGAAGWKSLEAYGYEEAQGYFERAVESLDPGDEGEQAARLWLGLGTAMAYTLGRHELQASVDALTRSFDISVSQGRNDLAISAPLTPLPNVHGPTGMTAMIERALEFVEEGTAEQARLLGQYLLWVSMEQLDHSKVAEYTRSAIEIARRVDDPELELRISSNALSAVGALGEVAWCMELANSVVELSRQVEAPGPESVAREFVAAFLIGEGKISEAIEMSDAAIRAAERSKNRFHIIAARQSRASIATFLGDFETARGQLSEFEHIDPDEIRYILSMTLISNYTDERDLGMEQLEKLWAAARRPDAGSLARWVALTQTAEFSLYHQENVIPQDIEERGLAVIRSWSRDKVTVEYSSSQLQSLLLVSLVKNELDEINKLRAAIEAAPAVITGSDYRYRRRNSSRMLALASTALHEYDRAADEFDKAIVEDRALGALPELGWECLEYATMLLERGNSGDRDKASELQDEAIAIAQELGMKPLLERVLAQREILKA
ncbi:MAG: protein kinase [Chloroflexi bacterium]|nr:protein kinase [Chloroflexota bacterium]